MAYFIEDAVLLSAKAQELDPEVLEAHALVAESALDAHIASEFGLSGGNIYEDDALEQATAAVVRQVNRQVAEPENPYLESISRGSRSEGYGITREIGGVVPLDPLAVKIWKKLAEDAALAALPDPGLVQPRQSATVSLLFTF